MISLRNYVTVTEDHDILPCLTPNPEDLVHIDYRQCAAG